MSFQAHVKKFQSIEDGSISVLLRVPAEDIASVTALYQRDVVVNLPESINQPELFTLKDLIVQQIGQLEQIKEMLK